jgi:hypothetical protein
VGKSKIEQEVLYEGWVGVENDLMPVNISLIVLALFARLLHYVMIYSLTDVAFALTLVSER